MKKLYILILLLSITLTGCNNNDLEIDDSEQEYYNTLKIERLETFNSIDFSKFTITSIEKLLYDNGLDDYEYEVLVNVNDDFLNNIIEISNQFSNYNYSIDYPLSLLPGGGHTEVVFNLEYLNESVRLLLFRGYPDPKQYRSIIIFYDNGEEEIGIRYSSVFPNEFENIYNLLNES